MLASQTVKIPFGIGLNEKIKSELIEPGQAVGYIQNLRINKTGSYEKRNGYSALAEVDGGYRMGQFRSAPVVFDGTNLQNYVSTGDYWVDVGEVPEATATRSGLIAASSMAPYYDQCYASGVTGLVYIKRTLTATSFQDVLYVALFDTVTGNTIRNDRLIAAPAGSLFKVRAVAVGSKLVFLYNISSNNTLARLIYDASSPLTAPAFTSIAADIVTYDGVDEIGFDACQSDDTHFAVAYRSTAATDTLQVSTYTVNAATTPVASVPFTAPTTVATVGMACNLGDTLWVSVNGLSTFGAANVDVIAINPVTLAAVTTFSAVLHLTTASSPTTITIYPTGTQTATIAAGNNDSDRNITWDRMAVSGISVVPAGTGGDLYRFAIMGKMLKQSGKYYLPIAVYDNFRAIDKQIESTGFLVELTEDNFRAFARPVATFVARGCDMTVASLWAPQTIVGTNGPIALYPQQQEAQATSLEAVSFDFNAANRWQNDNAQSSMSFSTGTPSQYDGQESTEYGFLNAPGHIDTGIADFNTGSIDPGVYSYTAIYEWVTATGELVQSAPCPVKSHTVSAAPSFKSNVEITVPTAQLSYRVFNESSELIRILVYRTTVGGTVYHQLPPRLTQFNDASEEFAVFTDDTTDAALEVQPLLYSQPGTTGTALPKFCPPNAACMVVHRNRLFFVSDTGTTIYYSGQFITGEQPWFSDLFTIEVPKGGPITAMASMDGVLYIFKRDLVFSVTGEGPADNGASNDFSTPEEIDIEVGCVEPRSIVLSPGGIFYQSPRGIYLLTRSRTSFYAGQNVEVALDAYPVIVSANISDKTGCIYWECANSDVGGIGATIVYDFVHEQWLLDFKSNNLTGAIVGAHGATVIGGTYYWSTLLGQVNVESQASHLDAGRWVTASIETPWLKMANIEGYQRLRRTQILFEKDFNDTGSFGLTVSAYRNYDNNNSFQDWTWTDAELDAFTTPLTQIQLDPSIQKNESVLFTITDAAPTTGDLFIGRGPTWIGMMIEVGIKTGLFKLPNANTK